MVEEEVWRSLVWRPAPAREHSSEGFEPRKVIEVKEEDDEENAIEVEIETN